MIGIDTNVLVRYIAQDDQKQSVKATRIVEALTADSRGYVSIVVLVELVWVLESCYDVRKDELVDILGKLLRTKEIVVANADAVLKALRIFTAGKPTDFADCLVESLAEDAGCEHTVTFDRNAAKHCGMHLLD